MTAHNHHPRRGAKAAYTNLFSIVMALQCIQLYIYFMLCIVLVSENKISKSLNFGCLVLVKIFFFGNIQNKCIRNLSGIILAESIFFKKFCSLLQHVHPWFFNWKTAQLPPHEFVMFMAVSVKIEWMIIWVPLRI